MSRGSAAAVGTRAELGTDLRGGLVHLGGIGFLGRDGGGEIVAGHIAGGEDVHVGVGDVESRDERARPGRVEGPHYRLAYLLRHLGDARPGRGVEVGPAVNLGHGHHQGMPVGHRFDR